MKVVSYVYNALSKLARRIVTKMRQLRRDVLLIVLTVVLTAFTAIVPSIVRTNWSVVTITWYSIVIIALLFMIWTIVRGIQKIDEQEVLHQKEDTRQLIKDTVEKTLKELGLTK